MITEIERAAWHEAGHCLAGLSVGRRLVRVDLGCDGSGAAVFEADAIRAIDRAFVSATGPAAECYGAGEQMPDRLMGRSAWSGDVARLEQYANSAVNSEQARGLAVLMAKSFVADNASSIRTVANILRSVAGRALSQVDVLAIVPAFAKRLAKDASRPLTATEQAEAERAIRAFNTEFNTFIGSYKRKPLMPFEYATTNNDGHNADRRELQRHVADLADKVGASTSPAARATAAEVRTLIEGRAALPGPYLEELERRLLAAG